MLATTAEQIVKTERYATNRLATPPVIPVSRCLERFVRLALPLKRSICLALLTLATFVVAADPTDDLPDFGDSAGR